MKSHQDRFMQRCLQIQAELRTGAKTNEQLSTAVRALPFQLQAALNYLIDHKHVTEYYHQGTRFFAATSAPREPGRALADVQGCPSRCGALGVCQWYADCCDRVMTEQALDAMQQPRVVEFFH